MKYFYYKLALILSFFLSISLANANPTLKQCIDRCHKKSLNLKDFKHCKEGCIKRVKKRQSKKNYQKNYTGQPAEIMPSVETAVQAANPQQAELAAAAATGAAASVLAAANSQAVIVEAPVDQNADEQGGQDSSAETPPDAEQVAPEASTDRAAE